MRVILTDLTDHPNPELRGVILRVLDDTNCLILQGNMYGRNGRECCERIAAALKCDLEYVGRPQHICSRIIAGTASVPLSTVDAPADYAAEEVAQQGLLF